MINCSSITGEKIVLQNYSWCGLHFSTLQKKNETGIHSTFSRVHRTIQIKNKNSEIGNKKHK